MMQMKNISYTTEARAKSSAFVDIATRVKVEVRRENRGRYEDPLVFGLWATRTVELEVETEILEREAEDLVDDVRVNDFVRVNNTRQHCQG